ncbi:MAG: hypothetical protein WCL46_10580 [Chlorobium sp.]
MAETHKGDVNAPGGIATEEDRQPERRKALIFGLYLGNMPKVNLWRVAQNRCESFHHIGVLVRAEN